MYLSITYDLETFFYKTKEEMYRAMNRMDYGAFTHHNVKNESEAIAKFALEAERNLTESELETIKRKFKETL